MMYYVWFPVSFSFLVCFMIEFDTYDVLCIVSRYRLILDKFYVTFPGCHLGAFIVIVYKAPGSLTSVFKPCYSPDLERADFGRQSFQYTWLNSYSFSSFRASIETKHPWLLGTTW